MPDVESGPVHMKLIYVNMEEEQILCHFYNVAGLVTSAVSMC